MTSHTNFSRRLLAILFCLTLLPFSTKVLLAQSSSLSILINGTTAKVSPPAKLEKGSVLVPLRGVLEKLGAIVVYKPQTRKIIVAQSGRTFVLGIGLPTATLDQIEIPLSAAPKIEDGSTYVPLRSLAQLFGYKVQWHGSDRTVLITSKPAIDHLANLKALGHFGVGIDALNITDFDDANTLLDAAQKSGASFIKLRFDWSLLQPTADADFQWQLFDRMVRGAKTRGLAVIGVLGNSTQWASIYPKTTDQNQWRNGPPRKKYFPNWDNYVRRVVGRYHTKVDAWQVWEYPASFNFRSGARDYRIIVRRGSVMARLADPDAVVFAADSGGVNLGFLHQLKANGIYTITKGIMLQPLSQWQPGVLARPSEFLLPYSTLSDDGEIYWADGLAFPVMSEKAPGYPLFHTKDKALIEQLQRKFTPQAQADYLVRSSALALAAGLPKIIWANLRDKKSYPKVSPVNPASGSGLLQLNNTPRMSDKAFATLNRLLGTAHYMGAVAKGPHAVVLVFNDSQNIAVAWTPDDSKQVVSLETDNTTPTGTIPLQITDNTQIMGVAGKVLSHGSTIRLTSSPIWITDLKSTFVDNIKDNNRGNLQTLTRLSDAQFGNSVSADFMQGQESENGLYWKKYSGFRGEAQPNSYSDKKGLRTTISRDIYNPGAGNPSIYLDVDDAVLYNAPGVPVTVTVTLNKPRSTGTDPFRPQGGFNIQYDSPRGFLHTHWQTVEQGKGTVSYTFNIPNAAFANRDGYDLLINTWGSKQDLVFQSVKVTFGQPKAPPKPVKNEPQATPAVPTLPPSKPVQQSP